MAGPSKHSGKAGTAIQTRAGRKRRDLEPTPPTLKNTNDVSETGTDLENAPIAVRLLEPRRNKKLRMGRQNVRTPVLSPPSTPPSRSQRTARSPPARPCRIYPIRKRKFENQRRLLDPRNRTTTDNLRPRQVSAAPDVSELRANASGRSGAAAKTVHGLTSSELVNPCTVVGAESAPKTRAATKSAAGPRRGFTLRRNSQVGEAGSVATLPDPPLPTPSQPSPHAEDVRHSTRDASQPLVTQPAVTSRRMEDAEKENSELRAEIAQLKQRVNEYKRKVSEADQDRECLQILNRAAVSDLKTSRAETVTLRMQNESLKASRDINIASRRGVRSTSGSGTGNRICEISVDMQFVGIAEGVIRQMLVWAQREVSELRPELILPARNWRNRAETGVEMGIPFVAGSEEMCIPYPPLLLAGRREYYTPSFRDEKDFLSGIVRQALSSPRWSSVFTTDCVKKECEIALLEDRFIRKKMKQTLSDALSKKKRDARDKLFQSLGYTMLLSRKSSLAPGFEMEEKVRQKEDAEKKLLRNVEGLETLDMSWWRTATAEELACEGHIVTPRLQEPVEGDLFFRNAAAVQVIEAFLGFAPVLEDGAVVQSSILYLARLDAWIATVAKCLGIPEGRGGQRQRTFNDYYHSFFTLSVEQILAKVCDYVSEKYPEELHLDWSSENPVVSTDSQTRVATSVVEVPSTKKYYIAIRPDWFNENVSAILGDVLDCYIAEAPCGGGHLKVMGQRAEARGPAVDSDDSREQDWEGGGSRKRRRRCGR